MAQKSNIRSMRFSDEIIKIIESQEGDTFTAKFENLIRRCIKELPNKERQLEETNKLIKLRREQLDRITDKFYTYQRSLNNIERNLSMLEVEINKAKGIGE